MSVEHADIIDMVSVEDSTDTLCLLMVEPREWGLEILDERVAQLEAKVNQYLHYLASGQAFKDTQVGKASAKRVELYCRSLPPSEMNDTFRAIRDQLTERHIGFRVLVGGSADTKPIEHGFE